MEKIETLKASKKFLHKNFIIVGVFVCVFSVGSLFSARFLSGEYNKIRRYNQLVVDYRQLTVNNDGKKSVVKLDEAKAVINSSYLLKRLKRVELDLLEDLKKAEERNSENISKLTSVVTKLVLTEPPLASKQNQTTPAPTPAPNYFTFHCPRILKAEDNLGNSQDITSRPTQNISVSDGAFKKGEVNTIVVKITVFDPQKLPLFFQPDQPSNVTILSSSTNDGVTTVSYSINVTNAPVGPNYGIYFKYDNRDDYPCAGTNRNDGSASFTYNVTP